MTDQEIKDYLKELITTNLDICKAVNKLSRKVKKLSKPSNYDLNNIFGDPVGELDKVFDCCKTQAGDKVVNEPKTEYPDYVCVIDIMDSQIKKGDIFKYKLIESMYDYYYQNISNPVNGSGFLPEFFTTNYRCHFEIYNPKKETPLTNLNNKDQSEKQAKELVNKIEQFTNGWAKSKWEQIGGYAEFKPLKDNDYWVYNSGMKQIQATKASIEAINFILDNDFSRSELLEIKERLNEMA